MRLLCFTVIFLTISPLCYTMEPQTTNFIASLTPADWGPFTFLSFIYGDRMREAADSSIWGDNRSAANEADWQAYREKGLKARSIFHNHFECGSLARNDFSPISDKMEYELRRETVILRQWLRINGWKNKIEPDTVCAATQKKGCYRWISPPQEALEGVISLLKENKNLSMRKLEIRQEILDKLKTASEPLLHYLSFDFKQRKYFEVNQKIYHPLAAAIYSDCQMQMGNLAESLKHLIYFFDNSLHYEVILDAYFLAYKCLTRLACFYQYQPAVDYIKQKCFVKNHLESLFKRHFYENHLILLKQCFLIKLTVPELQNIVRKYIEKKAYDSIVPLKIREEIACKALSSLKQHSQKTAFSDKNNPISKKSIERSKLSKAQKKQLEAAKRKNCQTRSKK